MTPTAAPWTVTVWDHGILIYGGPNDEDIADFSFADQHTVSISKDEAVANATLCAAAHDLLEASKAVISAWYSAASSNVMFDAIGALHAAISKATTVAP